MMRNVCLMTPAAVICVAVRNNGFVNRFPGVEIHICSGAINAFIIKLKKWRFNGLLVFKGFKRLNFKGIK